VNPLLLISAGGVAYLIYFTATAQPVMPQIPH
jgi:hypothetical protein